MSRPPLSLDRLTPDQRRLFELRRRQLGISAAPLARIARRPPGSGPAECSSGQRRFWFLEQLDDGAGTYNVATAVRLHGRCDRERLAASLGLVVERHEALRTTFHLLDGRLVQSIHPRLAPEFSAVDLAGSEDPESAARAAAVAEAHRPFDLSRGPLLRLALFRLADGEHLALLTLHHIVADGWSLGVLVRELALAYAAEGRPADLPELPLQYADFAAWQRSQLASGALDGQLAEWRRRLAGAPTLELPTDRPRDGAGAAGGGGGGPGGTVELPFGGPVEALHEAAQGEGATLFMALLAAFSFLLARLAGQREVVVGTPVAGRGPAETHGLIGLFVNTLALRLDLAGDPGLRQLIGRAREVALAAFADQDLPFERLVEELAPDRQLGRSPVFQAMIMVPDAPMPPVELPGLVLELDSLDSGVVQFDLTLIFEEGKAGQRRPRLALAYRSALFDRVTAERWGGHLVRWIAAAVAAPDVSGAELDLFSPAERHQLLREWNDSGVAEDGLFLHQLFEAWAARRPEAAAVVYPGGEVSYGTLDRRASGLAAVLRGLGVGPEVRVAVCLDRSPELLVAVLAVWKAGGAYLPLDPALPRERRRMLLADAGAALLVTRRALAEELLDTLDGPGAGPRAVLVDEPLPSLSSLPPIPAGSPELSPDSLAWVMYTSGSTGTPNGVLVPHRGAVPLLRYLAGIFGMGPASRVLQVTAVGFDVSLMEIFLALANGGSLCQVTEEERLSPGALADRLEQRGVTTVVCTPAFLDLLPASRLPDVAVVGVGGEASSAALAERWARGRRLINCYGPTEATIYAVFEVMDGGLARADRPPAIGRPSPGMEAHVLDGGLLPVPPGAPGELALGGIGLARGYLDRPHRTAERFVPHPFAAAPGERLYRTGDLVRRLPDGRLEFLGRIDHQVKIRGVRIELGEIEAVLRTHPAVLTAAVLAPLRTGTERRLLAWVVPRPGQEAAPAELRRFLAERLPAAMVPIVPAHIVALDALPVTATGKLDRKALECRAAEIGIEERARTAPRTPAERLVAGIWQQVLELPEVGVDDDFFALGGSSIQAAILTHRLEEELGERVWVAALFDAPTVERLTAYLLATCPAGMARAIGVVGVGGVGAADSEGRTAAPSPVRIQRRQPGAEPVELSSGQQRFWFLEQLDGGAGTYHIAAAVGLRGRLDPARLAAGLGAVAARHEALRTTFHLLDGRLVQRIHPHLAPEVSFVDLSGAAPAARTAAAAWVHRSFDLARGPLLRLALLRLADQEHLALLTLHHIVADGWSLGVLVRELARAYEAGDGPADLPELPIQYADFARWQRARLAAGELDGQLAEWRRELAGAPVLELPTDRPRELAEERGAAPGGSVELPFGGLAAIGELAQGEGATLFMALLAAFSGVLARLAGQPEVVVGTPVAGRGRAETHGLIGLFVDTLALRLDLAGDPSPRRLIRRAREVTLAAFSRQDLPFDRLVEALAPERQPGRSPVFQAMLTAQNTPLPRVELPGLVLEPRDLDADTIQVDLNLTFEEHGLGGRSRAVLQYRRDLFDRATAERWGGHLVRWIAAAVAAPDASAAELDLLSPAERQQLLREWNDTTVAEDGLFLHQLFEAQAARRPEALALVHPGGELSYGSLDRRASELAAVLRGLGVGPEARVGVCLDRSPELLVALLAVWKAGGAYLPLDPALPRERRRMLLADAGAALLVTRRALAEELLGALDESGAGPRAVLLDEPLPSLSSFPPPPSGPPALSPDSLAWVMYTSGSTGTPNGVLVPHRGAVPLLRYLAGIFGMGPASRVLQVTAVGFDVSLMEIFLALANGGSLCQVTEEERLSPGALADRLEQRGVTTVVCTPAFLDLLPASRLPDVAVVGVGGEASSAALAERWARGRRLINCYGPTEATIYAVFEVMDGGLARADRPPAIGRPSPGMEAHVLDGGLLPVPPGAPGELALGGIGLARGYLGRPHRTAERFVPHPFAAAPGERLYRTGDLVRRLPDGRLEFLGRIDHQVKIRGVRIELGEIEAVLRTHPAVLTAAVLAPLRAPSSAGGERQLLAWVVPRPGQEASPVELRRFLAERLPAAMVPIVPAHIVTLDALPVTATGKLDRKALESRAAEIGIEESTRTAPRTPAERLVARLWQEVLKLPEVGIDDDFFALGGSSIQAAILTNRLEEELGERVWVVALFDAPTVERLTAYLLATCPAGMARATGASTAAASPAGETAKPSLPLRREVHAGPLPLSFAQERLWFLDRLEPGSPAYVIPATVRLYGVLDVEALAASLAEVVRRHSVLRTCFGLAGGRPVQIVDDPLPGTLALPRVDLAGLGARAVAEAGRLAAAEAVRPFDLAKGPLLRAALLHLGREEQAVLVALHHIAGDAWSIGVLVAEIAVLYPAFAARRPSPLPELPVQYADFAVWQREQLAGEELARQLAWWRQRLAGAPLVLELPADRPRPPVQSFRGAAVTAALPPALAAGLGALGARGGTGTTPFMTLLAGFQALLGRVTGQPTLLVGSTIANRTRRELEPMLGFFANTLVLRADLAAEERFAVHLGRVRADTLGAYVHQDLPFELLVEELRPPRDLARAPLVQVIFQMQNAPAAVLEVPGLRLEPMAVQAQTAKFDLVVSVSEEGGGMSVTWGYSTDLFDRATVVRLAGHFAALLAGAAADPDRRLGDLPLLAPGERHQLLVECNPVLGPGAGGVPELLHERFARVAAAREQEVAVVCRDERWSYGELAAWARWLARVLVGAGVKPGDRVGLFLDRSLELVAAVLAVMETGAAYVPVDPGYPAERVAFVLADSGVKAVVSQRHLEARLPGLPEGGEIVWVKREGEGVVPRSAEPLAGIRAVPGSPAYVIYTSGSTGRPKGVEVSHAQVSRLFDSTREWFGFGPADVWTLFHSIAFDFSVWELWGPLLTGGRLVVVPYEVSRSPEAFYELLAREGVTVLNQTPSAFRQLIWAEESVRGRDAAGEVPALRLREVIFGGEALEPASLAPWVARHGDGLESGGPRLVNMYGITETTVHVTWRPLMAAEIRGGVGSVIGVPIPDLAVYLVDRQLHLVPLGVPGEILVGGAGLALGYLGRPDLTAERFVPDPFSHQRGARLYRSGDLARRRPPYPDKDLEYIGRIDHQIKIRGFRIELGEIEAALAALPGVREATVLVREESGEKRLVAYVVGEAGELPDLATARTRLAASLPDYMLPSALIHLPALPLTAHGKIDRQALPAPGAAPAAGRVAPRTALEHELAGLFSEVLGGAVGIGANSDGANSDVGAELASARVEASSTPTEKPKPARQSRTRGAVEEDGPGVDDDFFALGGSSISGAVLINRLQQRLGEIVHVVAIFDAPTVARLAAYLGTQHREAVVRIWGSESLGSTSPDSSADSEPAAAGRIDEAAVERLRGLIPAPIWSVREPTKNPRALFVLSPPRSGSTLLRVMLAGHPALFAPPELELLGFETLAERSAAFASPRDSFWLEGAVRAVMAVRGYGAEEAREELAAAEREGLTTLDFYGRLQSWLDGRTLVDKTPSYALSRKVLERAEAGFEEPFYVHLVRHPLGMIQSFEEAKLDQIFLRRASEGPGGFGRRELAELIWVVSQENIRGFLAGVPAGRRHELRFEELVRDPEGTLSALCAALGLEYEPAMARPYEEAGGGRMTDGLHADSRMLGNVKFHQHRGIDAAAAERWRQSRRVAELGEVTVRLARSLGYAIAREGTGPADTAVRIPVGGWRPGEPVALSFAQERLWFIDQLEPGSPAYTITSAVRLSGALSVPALAGSLAAVVERHAALRTCFALSEVGENGERPVQIVEAVGRAGLPLVDLAALPEACAAAEVRCLAGAAARAPFDLGRGPLLRALLVRMAADEHLALLNLHHIVGDGWSMSVLTGELGAFYRAAVTGAASPLPELPVQYPDFALWQRGRLAGAELERQVAWWRQRLAGVPTVLDLPADRPRPAVLSLRGAELRAQLPARLGAVLGPVTRRAGATSFMALLAGFTALVGRITGRSTVVVGSTIANRTRRELEDLIGFFVNTLALRADLVGEEGFAAHLRRVREATLAAWAHQDLPFEKLVEELRPPRDPSRAPLVQVLCQMQNVPAAAVELPGVRLTPLLDEGQSAKFDLVVNLAEHEGRFVAVWRYSTDLFDRPTIARLAGHFATLLEAAARDPEARLDELPLLAPGERHQLLVECNPGSGAQSVPELLHRRFAEVAAARAQEVAVVCGDERWSYGELAARARRLAWYLVGVGVKPGDRVGLFLDRSMELVAAVLAVVETGAAYVPVDPGYPAERVAFVLADSGVRTIVSQRHLEARLPGLPDGVEIVWVERGLEGVAPRSAEPLSGVSAVPGSPAYVIYTSGSTGRPKGVEVSHAQVARLFDATAEWFQFGPNDVWTLFHSIAFDFSVWELWGPLLTGGRLVVVPYEVSRSPEAFYELLAREGVTVLNQTPSAFRQLIWAEESVRGRDMAGEVPALRLREVIFGGEALEPASLAPWVARHGDGLESGGPRLVNMYGITETTVHVTWRPLSAAEIRGGTGSVIGVPIPDLAVYLVDRALQPVPLGVPGEILVGGAGLALGYLGRPDLTAERFVPDPFSHQRGARLYRSGDLARRRPPYPDKDLEYIGRVDHQIKIRGFRIELGEIEAALARHPAVREAVVTLREKGGEKRLVAYVAGEEAELPDLAAARALLAATLPDYMLPSALVHLPALPLTVHGKIDRRALPAPGAAPAAGHVAPRTALERDLAGLFAEALRTGTVGLDDDFFELGGNSISGAVLINRLQREVGEIIHVVAIFDAPTVRRLAAYLETQHREAVRRRWGASAAAERWREGRRVAEMGEVTRGLARGLGYDIDPEPVAGDPVALRIAPGTWVPGTPAPLSFAQERLWFLDRLEPGSPAYHLTSALRLTGALDVAALGAAVTGVVRRHAALRTTFPAEGDGPVQRVADAASMADLRWPVVDLAALPEVSREVETRALAQAEARRPFDLAAGPLLRTLLLRLGTREHAAVVVQHHIVSDGWSMGVFVRELVALYTAAAEGVPARLPELPVQYPDFAIWQRRHLDGPALDGPALERQLAWWRARLAGAPPELELPFDRPRTSSGRAAGRKRPFPPVPGPLAAALAGLGRRRGASLFMTLLAGFSALLARVSNQPDVVVGSPIAGRNRAEIEGLIGFFVNTLALRADLGGDPGFDSLLGQVRETVLGAFEHQEVPFEKLVADLAPERNLNAAPLFQVMFALQNAAFQNVGQNAGEELAAPGLAVSALATDAGSSKFDLLLGLHEIAEGVGGIGGTWGYRTDLFDGATVERLGRHFIALLEAVAADPDRALSEIPLLAAAERQALLVEWNDPVGQEPRTGFVHRLVAAQATARPAAPAVVDGATGGVQTYGELAARAARLARRLNELGVGPERPVGVYLDRCLDLPAVLLGVFASGGIYLPLDPAYPAERLVFQLADAARCRGRAELPLVLTRAGLLGSLPDALSGGGAAHVEVIETLFEPDPGRAGDSRDAAGLDRALDSPLDPDNAAYAIYTSGSTGTPKGVVVSHRALANRVLYHAGTLSADDAFLHKAAIGFDVSLGEILIPLAAGGRTVLAPPGGQDSAALLRVIGERRVTHVSFPPTTLAVLLDEPGFAAAFRAMRSVTTGGETVPAELVERFARRHGAELVNRYGPTETTISVTAWRCRPGERGLPPIGRPVAAAELYVLDRRLRPVPPGVAGEICVGGVAVARGYLGRPDLTAAAFCPDPHAGVPGGHDRSGGARNQPGGARLYCTGDRGRFRADGVLEFLGRMDRQVKVRGFRVELGEIESALLRLPAVREAAVVDRADGASRSLVAFVTAAGDPAALAAAGLREALGRSLPAWMVPAAFVPLPALPLSPTGKVDRRALAELAAVARDAGEVETGAPVEPLSEIEELIAGLWQELLGAGPGRRLRPGDDFFALGGHSLLATQLVSRLRAAFGVELPLRAVFEAPTLAEMAGALAAFLQTPSGAEAGAGAGALPLVPRARPGAGLPLSFAQERLWFIQRLAPDSPWYNMATGLRLEGTLDVPALALAFAGVVRRHESLRTTFRTAGGRPRQVIAPALELPLPLVDLTALSALGDTARAAELRRLARSEARRPFDLERGPLARTLLARLAPGDHALLLTLHHLVSDGWSMGVLSRELTALYRNAATGEAGPALAPLPVQYADFALWQRELLTGANLELHLDYWRRQLAGAPTVLELPGDRPRPAVETLRGGAARFGLSAEGTAGVQALSRRLRATVSMTVLAAWELLLSRWTGQEDLLVGSAVANRTRREIEDLIGFFVNILVLRGRLDGDPSFAELAGRVREASLGAYAHQDLPFERLVEELQVERDLRRNPLCQVMVGFQNFPVHRREVAGLTFHPLEQGATETGTAKADLILFAMEEGGRLAGALEYNADLFDGATAARLAAQLDHLLAAAATDPERPIRSLPLLGAGERHQLLREWNDCPAEPRARRAHRAEVPFHRLFERWASEAPDAAALAEDAAVWSYGELDRRANRLAHRLLRQVSGAEPEMRVAVCLERSAAGVAAWLAVLKAGGAFVPLDPEAPADRIAWVLRDAGCAALLTRGELLANLSAAGLPAGALPAVVLDVENDLDTSLPEGRPAAADRVESGHLAYVIYTSGSTGRPKGVLVTHRGLGNLGAVLAGLCALDRDGRLLQVASPVFDAAVGEVAAAAWAGAALHFAPRGTPLFGPALCDLLAERAITAAHITPSALATVPPAPLPALRALLIVGEACPLELARRWAAPGRRLVNGYGPTEGTVGATGEVWGGGDRLPIGRPFPGVAVHLLDRYRAAVPPLVPGEIWLGGVGLARGYLGRPDLTAERFVPNPFAATPGARLYRTGDLARRLPDGRLEFLGRVDHQVKLRGIRIELGEIEAALAEHPAVAAAAARVYEVQAGDRRLGVWAAAAPELLDGSAAVARAAAAEHLAAWRELAGRTHGSEPAADETFDIAGWTSSFTGEPLPAVEMREWVDHTVAELLGLAPTRVLEIGCGTGLLLQRVAPSTELYLGTDLAAAPLAALDRRLAGSLPQVRLEQRPADDFAGLPERGFDLVVLNSVVQYFPSAAYLEDVLSRALDAVADGGALYVGDVRSLALLGAFHTAVELHRAESALSAEALRRQVEARRLHEKELVLDPAFFLALAERLPRITRVEVRPKSGRARNELLLFRYQVVLHVGAPKPEPRHRQPLHQRLFQWSDWSAWSAERGGEGGPLQPLRDALAEQPELLALCGIPNTRTAAATAAARLLAAGEARTVRELRARAATAAAEAGGIDPEDLRELGTELGYRVQLGWSRPGSEGTFEAVFARPERAAAGLPDLHPPGARRPGARTANTPLLDRLAERLVPELRRHLAERLPEPLMTAHLALLEALPLTATGKVDRGALPIPDGVLTHARPAPAQAPRNAIEQVLADTWAEVLGLTSVGVEDNFFALGGHSLLATQLLSRVTAIFRVDLPLRRLFETPTVAALAAEIVAREATPGQSERLAKVLLKVKSRAEAGAPVG